MSFLQGEFDATFSWLEDLGLHVQVDLEILAFHFGVTALQCAAIASLHRALIGGGRWANWAMMIHVWAVSEPSDPIRPLVLSSFYLNVVVFGGRLKLPRTARVLQPVDYEEDMWFSDFHEMLEAYSSLNKLQNRDEWRAFNQIWHPRSTKPKFKLDDILDQIRGIRDGGWIQHNSIFTFPDPSASLQQGWEEGSRGGGSCGGGGGGWKGADQGADKERERRGSGFCKPRARPGAAESKSGDGEGE